MYVYLPSCNFTAASPAVSKKIKEYLAQKPDMRVAGCCRPTQKTLTAQDTVLSVCQSCSAITREASPQAKEMSLWEYALADPEFPWPDYGGEAMTLQDCWRARNNPAVLDAVRDCMRRMNLQIVELAENREHTTFDGTWLFNPMVQRNLDIAPNYYSNVQATAVTPLPKEEQAARMREWVKQYTTDRVVTYCNACLRGVQLGGGNGVHLLDLMAAKL